MNRGDGPEFVVKHDYPALFLGPWFFFLVGGWCLLMALLPSSRPNWPMVLAIGLGFVGVGVMIRWIGTALSESIVLNDETITWLRGGDVRLRLSLEEVKQVRFADGYLIIEGARPGDVIQVAVNYPGFDAFLEGLKSLVRSPWVSLVGAAPAQASSALVAPPREAAPLPLVHNRWGAVVLLVAVWLGLGAVALAMWLVPSFLAPNEAAPQRAKEGLDRREMAKYLVSVMSAVAFLGIFFTRAQFRIDEHGVDDIYLFRARRYGWAELRSIAVSTTRPYFDGALVVTPKKGALITVPLGKESYLFSDTALAAAARAGYSLATEVAPLVPAARAPTGPSGPGHPEGIQQGKPGGDGVTDTR
jgi:hypothetical protein